MFKEILDSESFERFIHRRRSSVYLMLVIPARPSNAVSDFLLRALLRFRTGLFIGITC